MEPLKLARELGKAIQECPEYQALHNAKVANDNDAELNDLIGQFNLKWMEVENLMNNKDADQAETQQKNEQLRDLYEKIMANQNMQTFNRASDAMNKLMNYINNILVASVNGDDPETCDIEPHSCSGSCSSCGGCH